MGILDRFSLDGRVAIVTGASRGIGGAVAIAYAEAGAELAIVGRDRSTLEEQAHRIESIGRRCRPIVLDVAKTAELPRMIDETLRQFGRVDILANMAGTVVRRPILESAEEDVDRVLAVNLKSVYFVSQAAARAMIAGRERDPNRPRGKIVNIASLTSQVAFQNIASYGASRSGVVGLTRAMAVEWRDHISVNALAPGYVRTQQTEGLFQDPAWVERTLSCIPMGRTATVDDLTGIAVLLAADASDYMTGQVLYVDGGWLAAG